MLVIYPKTTATIIGIFLDETCMYKQIITHQNSFNSTTKKIGHEIAMRKSEILRFLLDAGINLSKLDAVAASGGLLKPVEGGTYFVTQEMIADLRINYNGKHASNLGGILAYEIAQGLNIPAFIVDPPVVNELNELATFTGLPEIKRKSIFHALNQKAVAREAAQELGKKYQEAQLIVCHLGYGITIGTHKCGKVIDVNNGLHGDGPFSIERAGSMPTEALLALCYSGNYTESELMKKITYYGGLKAYFSTEDTDKIKQLIQKDSPETNKIIQAMAYQIAKEIGSMATVLIGNVHAIVLSGEFAALETITEAISERVSWIADVLVYPGEYDLQALNAGTLRVLRKEESAKTYR